MTSSMDELTDGGLLQGISSEDSTGGASRKVKESLNASYVTLLLVTPKPDLNPR